MWLVQPNVDMARLTQEYGKSARLFGEDEHAEISRVCTTRGRTCVFVTAIFRKPSEEKTQDDSKHLFEALKTGYALAAKVTKAD